MAKRKPVRLNLGAGNQPIEGYRNMDAKTGDKLFPLDVSSGSVDEIRASHVLEHFPHNQVGAVLSDWCRALKSGGTMRIAVPNFETIARQYLQCKPIPVQGYIMGGQVDELDYHKAIFDQESLTELMRSCGLRSIKAWKSETEDCASYEISLNLEGVKCNPMTRDQAKAMKIGAAMSVPRLGFMDNFFCAFQTLVPLGIELRKYTGAFWGQCLERTMEEWMNEGKEWILTIDYDTVWTEEAINDLLELARDTDADAIAPLQAHRSRKTPLMFVTDDEGKPIQTLPRSEFDAEMTLVTAAHFGLTLIRVSALRDIPHPWFHGQPGEGNKWGKDRTDDDVSFWLKWKEHGKTLYLANRVPVGHAELMIRWPNEDFEAMYQHPTEFYKSGPPEGVWK